MKAQIANKGKYKFLFILFLFGLALTYIFTLPIFKFTSFCHSHGFPDICYGAIDYFGWPFRVYKIDYRHGSIALESTVVINLLIFFFASFILWLVIKKFFRRKS